MRHALFAASILLIAGCATLRSPLGGHTWNGVCYRALRQDVDHLAGPEAYDCGLLHLNSPDGAQTQISACAQHAAAGGAPFRFGYEGAGDDSIFCAVAVRNAAGQLYSLSIDEDTTGQFGLHGEHSAWSVQRCGSIEFYPGQIGPNSFFALKDCQSAPEVRDALEAQRATR